MQIVHSDSVVRVPPGTSPDYDKNNPLAALLQIVEVITLAGERMWYDADNFQFLVPIRSLVLYGPQGDESNVLDPALQDNKTDFQKQNVKQFVVADALIVRGLVTVGAWTGPFLRLSYEGGPDSALARAANGLLGDAICIWLKVGDSAAPAPIRVPYNPRTHRYDIEFWGYPKNDLRTLLTGQAADAFDRGELLVAPALVHGDASAFAREKLENQKLADIAPTDTMHPTRPLRIEIAWASADQKFWDSQDGRNYVYQFNMTQRGWDRFLSVGSSGNPHGGTGFLEYRNLLSNYGAYAGTNELTRALEPWMFDAFNSKAKAGTVEPFMAVDYVDLHVLRTECGIGLHRHRDNAEIFFLIRGRGYMVVGDWCQMPDRDRCLEIRTMLAGDLVMLRGGNLHGLMNPTDEDLFLLMFGGYD